MTVIGIESAASPALSTAIRAGRVCPVEIRDTLADGLAGNLEPGTVTVNLIRDQARRLIAVTEDQIAEAIRYLAREHGLIAEGAGAAPVAAILARLIPVTRQTVAIISGRNITLRALADVLQAGQQSPATRTGNSGSACQYQQYLSSNKTPAGIAASAACPALWASHAPMAEAVGR
jgi:threonine dehydratase